MAPVPASLQHDDEKAENEDDVVGELQSRVHNIQEAKRWILGGISSFEPTTPAAMGRDVYDEMPMTAMRRPTYAASVFQQARMMEADRQANASAAAARGSNSNIRTTENMPYPRTPGVFPPLTSYPRTPLTAFPEGIVEDVDEAAYPGPETAAVAAPAPHTWTQKTKHCLAAPWRFLQQQISPKYILTMMDPREILFPITIRKVALWTVYGGVIAMLVLLDRYYHWWDKLDHALHGKNLAIMGILYGFEPTMIVIIMLVARVPDARVVPDRTVLVPRGRDSTESLSDSSRSSLSSDDESVASQDMAAQMHSTILEEEHGDEEAAAVEAQLQDQENDIVDKDNERASNRLSLRRMSTRSIAVTPSKTANGERRPSQWINVSGSSGGLQVPRTPGSDPRNRRSTIILHEPLTVDKLNVELERVGSRRPSNPSHQMVLARTSIESRRSSYFGVYAAAAGSRLDVASLLSSLHLLRGMTRRMKRIS